MAAERGTRRSTGRGLRLVSVARLLAALALGVVACSRNDRSSPPAARRASAAAVATARGPDALLLRVPRTGGVARATAYPNIDSVVWTATEPAPPLERVLAFDADAGLIAAVDNQGRPLWLELRVGTVTVPTPRSPRGLISVDGSTIYGVGLDGAVARFAPPGNWVYQPALPARAVFPQMNGTVLVLAGRGTATRAWRMHPPDTRVLDSVLIPDVVRGVGGPLGDRVYFIAATHTLVEVNSRTLTLTDRISLDRPIIAMAATPSGDRLYVITDSSRSVDIVAGFQNRVSGHIELPGRARDVRVDPFGRYVLVRAAIGDSVWVAGVGTDKVLGTVHSAWHSDLPFVAPDGLVAVSDRADVAFIDPGSMKEVRRVSGGASDFWFPFVWSGFRPRAAALDEPAQFSNDSDSVARAARPLLPETTVARPAPPPPPAPDSTKRGFTVSFAVLLDPTRAQAQAAKINVDGRAARVVTSITDGTAMYRVVLGPFASRDEAERVGHASGQSYYVYAGSP